MLIIMWDGHTHRFLWSLDEGGLAFHQFEALLGTLSLLKLHVTSD